MHFTALNTAREDIKSRLSVWDILGEPAKRGNIKCPLGTHDDSSPSFSVFAGGQAWKCFACGEGGDIFALHQSLRRIDFIESLRELADKAGVEIKKATPAIKDEYKKEQRARKAIEWAAKHYHTVGTTHIGFNRWLESRAISEATRDALFLGWADGQLHKQALPEGLSLEDLVNAGLVGQGAAGPYDFFQNRYIFPLLVNSHAVSMSGRASDITGDQAAKYKHLQGSKTEHLYNERAIGRTVWLFEGHPDAVSAYGAGLPAVGVIGTQGLTCPERLARCEEIFIVPDQDGPGQKAAETWIAKIREVNDFVKIKIVTLPDGSKDFNEWLCKNRGTNLQNAGEMLLAAAKPPVLWKVETIKSLDDVNDVWPLLATVQEVGRGQFFDAIKQKFPTARVPDLRAAFKRWVDATAVQADNGTDYEYTDDFDEDLPESLKVAIDFDLQVQRAHVAVYARPKKRDRKTGDVVTPKWELMLITSTKRDGQYQAGKIYADDMVRMFPDMQEKDLPDREILKGRWPKEFWHPFIQGQFSKDRTGDLLYDIQKLIRSYVWLQNPGAYSLLACYVLMTYAARLFPSLPYLSLTGDAATGKSTIAEFLDYLCFNARRGSTDSTADFFRALHSGCITWIRDEAEQFDEHYDGDKSEVISEQRNMLNVGYTKGTPHRITVPDSKNQNRVSVSYDVFGPKVFCGINALNPVLRTRTVQIETYPKPKTIKLRNKDKEIGDIQRHCKELRAKLYIWIMTHFMEIHETYKAIELPEGFSNREWQLWAPLFVVASIGDKEGTKYLMEEGFSWASQLQRYAEETESIKQIEKEESDFNLIIVRAIHELIESAEIHSIMGRPQTYDKEQLAKKVSTRLREKGYLSNSSRDCGVKKVMKALRTKLGPDIYKSTRPEVEPGIRVQGVYIDYNNLRQYFGLPA